MSRFRMKSPIEMTTLEAIQLNINPGDYGILDQEETFLHIIEGEFMYCGYEVAGKIIVTENQFDQILSIENITIHKIHNSIIYINSLSPAGRNKFNKRKKKVEYLTNEKQDDTILQEDVLIFRLLS